MSHWVKVPRIVLRNLIADYYGTGTDDVVFDKYTIRVFEPQKNYSEDDYYNPKKQNEH